MCGGELRRWEEIDDCVGASVVTEKLTVKLAVRLGSVA
jgi:hypothetical protein